MKLIVGLGNPGKEYEATRHNLGFLVVRALAKKSGFSFKHSRLSCGMTADGMLAGQKCRFFLPATFMNRSGIAVQSVIREKKIDLPDLLVVCDDFHLEFGRLRIRPYGSAGGHNGLNSVIECLGTRDFGRLRVGIGSPRAGRDVVDFVLSEFKTGDKQALGDILEEAVSCCMTWLTEGMEKAMNIFNKRKTENE